MDKIVQQPTSYQARLAACGAAVDRLLTEHPDGPTPTAVTASDPATAVIHLAGLVDLMLWSRIIGTPVDRLYGARQLQGHVDYTVDGICVRLIGASPCSLGEAAHDHSACHTAVLAELVDAGLAVTR
jgi:hypothetical protein